MFTMNPIKLRFSIFIIFILINLCIQQKDKNNESIYKKCTEHLNKITIAKCIDTEKPEDIEKCNKWNLNFLHGNPVPLECLGKKYNISLLVNSKKINFQMDFNHILGDKKKESNENKKGKTQGNSEGVDEVNLEKLLIKCLENIKKSRVKCGIKGIEKEILPKECILIKRKFDNKIIKDMELRNIFSKIVNINKNTKKPRNNQKEEKREENTEFIKNENNDRSYKDEEKECIEYGLSPIDENIIICTKYD